jgi:hypothetical protein
MTTRPGIVSLSALAVFCLAAPVALRAGSERPVRSVQLGLVRAAPKILKDAREKGYRNIGVLKFLVKKGKGPLTDNAGTLNLDMARWLEQALNLEDDAVRPIGVIKDPSAVAAKLAGASHLRKEDRGKFFVADRYELRWGPAGKKVSAAAFLTGEVHWSPDLKTMKVVIVCFDRKGKLEQVASFVALAGDDDLARGGQSVRLRGLRKDAADSAASIDAGTALHPLDPEAKPPFPVELEIYYNGEPVLLDFTTRPGEARVPEPRRGQKVKFVLRCTKAAGKDRFGVVLKVNGENTLFRETHNFHDCTRWLLKRGDRDLVIDGFQVDRKTAREFEVVPWVESKAGEVNYGKHAGTFTLVVFRELKGKKPDPDEPRPDEPRPNEVDDPEKAAEENARVAFLHRGTYPKEQPRNPSGMRWQAKKMRSRGEVKAGTRSIESRVELVPFVADPNHLPVATIIYSRVPRPKQK